MNLIDIKVLLDLKLYLTYSSIKTFYSQHKYTFLVYCLNNIILIISKYLINLYLFFLITSNSINNLLFINNESKMFKIIEAAALSAGEPYIVTWYPGLVTNWQSYYNKILLLKWCNYNQTLHIYNDKYTKLFKLKYNQLKYKLFGLTLLTTIPRNIFIANIVHNNQAYYETLRVNCNIFTLLSTNKNTNIYTIPVNSNFKALNVILKIIISAIIKNKLSRIFIS